MNENIQQQIYHKLSSNHLCSLVRGQVEDDEDFPTILKQKLYGVVIFNLNIKLDLNQNTGRVSSNQGWYETFFNLVSDKLQRSSFSVTHQHRREIRRLASIDDDHSNPFYRFYEILEKIAQSNQRSFLLHFTQIDRLEDPESHLSGNDIQSFLEAIDSYCQKFSSPAPETQSQSSLYFFLEGAKFPQSEVLNNLQVLSQNIINSIISPKTAVPSPKYASGKNPIEGAQTTEVPVINHFPDIPSPLEVHQEKTKEIDTSDTKTNESQSQRLQDLQSENNHLKQREEQTTRVFRWLSRIVSVMIVLGWVGFDSSNYGVQELELLNQNLQSEFANEKKNLEAQLIQIKREKIQAEQAQRQAEKAKNEAEQESKQVQVELNNLLNSQIQRLQYTGSVSSTNCNDDYTFRIDRPGQVDIFLWDLRQDADLYLFDSSENQIASSTRGGEVVDIINNYSLSSSGRYKVQVRCYSGSSTSYDLNIYIKPDS